MDDSPSTIKVPRRKTCLLFTENILCKQARCFLKYSLMFYIVLGLRPIIYKDRETWYSRQPTCQRVLGKIKQSSFIWKCLRSDTQLINSLESAKNRENIGRFSKLQARACATRRANFSRVCERAMQSWVTLLLDACGSVCW